MTDVLAFDWKKGNGLPLIGISKKNKRDLYADIIISTDAVRENAITFRTSLPQELVLYIIHGVLHLLGFDDHDPDGIKHMRAKEAEVLKAVKRSIDRVVK